MMKFLALILLFVFAACNSSQIKENQQASELVKNNESPHLDISSSTSKEFDIYEYKKRADSLISEISGETIETKITANTLNKGEIVFVELKNTLLSDLSNENAIVKYTFSLTGKNSLLKHHLIIISCKDEMKANSVFALFEKIALENTGVPGLTYASDYLVRIFNEIFWLNSSCSYSYPNHMKFVDKFKKMKQVSPDTKAIECECGKEVAWETIKDGISKQLNDYIVEI